MAFQYKKLATVLEWKFGAHPNFGDGVSTRDGILTKFPATIRSFPTDVELEQWVDEWEALDPDHPAKNPRKHPDVPGNVNDIPGLRQELNALIQKLRDVGVIT